MLGRSEESEEFRNQWRCVAESSSCPGTTNRSLQTAGAKLASGSHYKEVESLCHSDTTQLGHGNLKGSKTAAPAPFASLLVIPSMAHAVSYG